MSKNTKPVVNIKFIFHYSNDIVATRRFYTDLIGFKELSFVNEDDKRWACYECDGGMQLVIMGTDTPLPPQPDWAKQPGYEGGVSTFSSYAVEVPESDFTDMVNRLKEAGVPAFSDAPEWRMNSYWAYTVKDPNGVTLELYYIPKEVE